MINRLKDVTESDVLIDRSQRYQLTVEGVDTASESFGSAAQPGDPDGSINRESQGNDWRDVIQDEKLREHATRFHSIDDLVKANLESRARLSKAIIVPGEKADDLEIAAYRRAMGVPDTPNGYDWPELPDDLQKAERVAAERAEWADFFHEHNFTKSQAELAIAKVGELTARHLQADVATDAAYAADQEARLRAEWPGAAFDRNRQLAERAVSVLFGEELEQVRHLETKDGRFVLDNATFVKAFAKFGREMSEGSLGGVLTENAHESISQQIADLRDLRKAAMDSGDQPRANRIQARIQELYAKRDGNQPVVGKDSRAA